MRIPPAQVLNRTPTVADVARWPEFYVAGPGHEVASTTECPHAYHLTDSCPGCDADHEAAGGGERAETTGPDRPTHVISVYRAFDADMWDVRVNGAFRVTTYHPERCVMEEVAHIARHGGQAIVAYQDDNNVAARFAAKKAALEAMFSQES